MSQARQSHSNKVYHLPTSSEMVSDPHPPVSPHQITRHTVSHQALRHPSRTGETMPLVNRPCWVCGKIWTEYADQVCYICGSSCLVESDSRSPRDSLPGQPAPSADGTSLHSPTSSVGFEASSPSFARR